MKKKSWHLDRRTLLRGAGVSLGLPLLESMAADTATRPAPRRFCGIYFPYGASLPGLEGENAPWHWFPRGEGREFQFNASLQALDLYRDHLTVFQGLSHPHGRRMGGHDTADIFLTGAEFRGSIMRNSVSLDQVIAAHQGDETRFGSLTLSTDGGVGEPTRSSTLSFSANGQPVPAQNRPRQVFDRLFGIDPSSIEAQRRKLRQTGSLLDLVLDHSREVRGRLGSRDQAKLDEYFDSVRTIETRVERSEQWLTVPKPELATADVAGLHLEADDSTPRELIQTMYDLIYLAFRTDSTRVATYQLGNMNGATSIAGKFSELIGLPKNLHGLAHGWNKKGGAEALGRWDQFLAEQFSAFLGRLEGTPEGEGTLLDHTLVFYGSSNSHTHQNENYPLLLAGGNRLGLRHGQHLQFGKETPLSNLFVTLLDRLQVPAESFADSTGGIGEILA